VCGHSLGAALPDTHQRPTRGSASADGSPLQGWVSAMFRAPGASGRCAAELVWLRFLPIWSCSVWGLPCLRVTAGAVRILPHFSPFPGAGSLERGLPGNRPLGYCVPGALVHKEEVAEAVFFLWQLAVMGFEATSRCYPAHCPAEFGLSSPRTYLRTPSGSDRPVLLPVVSVAKTAHPFACGFNLRRNRRRYNQIRR